MIKKPTPEQAEVWRRRLPGKARAWAEKLRRDLALLEANSPTGHDPGESCILPLQGTSWTCPECGERWTALANWRRSA